MAKNKIYLIFISLAVVVGFGFQNCANPSPHNSGRTSSSSTTPTPLGDTTPGLDRPDVPGVPNPPRDLPPLASYTQTSGTTADERAYSILETTDGGFITAGRAKNDPSDNSGLDVLFKKFGKDGQLIYSVRIGDTFEQQSFKAVEVGDAYVIAGLTRTVITAGENHSSDLMLVRVRKSDGAVIEAFRYGSTDVESINDLIYVSDNGGPSLVAVGYHYDRTNQYKSAMAIKFDMNYDIVWQRRFYLGTQDFVLTSLAYVQGKGYFAVGFRERSDGSKDSIILKFTYAGVLLMARVLNNPNNEDDLRDVGFDGTDIIAVGRLNGNGRSGEGVIYRFSEFLNLKSTVIVGRTGTLQRFMDLNTHPDGSLILAGLDTPNAGNTDNFIIKIRNDLSIEFQKSFGTAQNDVNQYHSLILRRDRGYAFITNTDAANTVVGGVRTMDPQLLLIDQYGLIPAGCNNQTRPDPVFQATPNNTFTFSNLAMSVADLTLTLEPLDTFDEVADTPTRVRYCVN